MSRIAIKHNLHPENPDDMLDELEAKLKPAKDLVCLNCNSEHDVFSLPDNNIRYGTRPNTLTNLPDRNNPEWKCPNCQQWHLNQDDEEENTET